MNWKRVAYLLYPFLIGLVLPALFLMVSHRENEAKAGVIRSALLTPDHPLIVHLALGRTTAISFGTRPEKVVPGNPQAVEINFLGKDLTLRPLSGRPGNLIVYTKNNRYVILLQITSDAAYDDAITVNGFSSFGRPIRLGEDTFIIEDVLLQEVFSNKQSKFSAIIRDGGRIFESDSFPDGLRCKGCVLKRDKGGAQLICARPISVLDCRSAGVAVQLKRLREGA